MNNIDDNDQVSLITFATDVRIDLGWTKKAGSESHVQPLFAGLGTRGATAMFSAVKRAVDMTRADDGILNLWIVLLCDGTLRPVSVSTAATDIHCDKGYKLA